MRAGVLLFLLAALAAQAEVTGIVTNRTVGKPQAEATVTLYRLGGAGPEAVESVKSDGQGRFTINQTTQGPAMLQTAFDGVVYSQMLPPGRPTTGLDVSVYQSRKTPGDAKLAQHIILLEATDQITVHETYFFENSGTTTYYDPEKGTLQFSTPENVAGRVEVTAKSPDGLPIPRAATPAGPRNTYSVDFPVKPGETRFDITYQIPYEQPQTFANRSAFPAGKTRLVLPAGVSASGDSIEFVGQEPQTQAFIYDVKAQDYSFLVEGTGSLRQGRGAGSEGPSIEATLPRIYDRLYIVLGLSFAVLLIGFLLMYRRGTAEAAAVPERKHRG